MTPHAELRWRPFRLPMRHRFDASHGALADRRGILIELTGRDGRRGYGEASPIASLGYGTIADVRALLVRYGGALPDDLDTTAPGVQALRCALDVAALDLEGQDVGETIAGRLAGDRPVARAVRVNAVIGESAAEETARFGLEATGRGYRVLKAKVGSGPLDEDVRRIVALRAACPDVDIRLDANGAWDEATALDAVRALASLRIELIEQPVAAGDVEALARVREAAEGALLIAVDESVVDPATLGRVLDRHAADLVVLKPMFLGGVRAAYAIGRRAEVYGIGAIVTTTFDSSIGTAAALHLAAALGGRHAHGLGTGEYLAADLVHHTLLAHEGMIALPEGYGLGLAPDEAAWQRVAEEDWVVAP